MGRHLEKERAGSPGRAAAGMRPGGGSAESRAGQSEKSRPGAGVVAVAAESRKPRAAAGADSRARQGDKSPARAGAIPAQVQSRGEGPEEKDLLALYIRQIARYALLTGQDEQEIGGAIQVSRDELAGLEKKAAAAKFKLK